MNTHFPKLPWVLFACLGLLYLAVMHSGLPLGLRVVFKLLPIAVLVLLANRSPQAPRFLTIALLFSACGDALLAVPLENGFVFGLSAFLLAQLTYTFGFLRNRGAQSNGRSRKRLLFLLAYGVALAFVVLPETEALALPVALYFLAIFAMAGTAAIHRYPGAALFAGAFVFVLSDSMIAFDKFVLPFEGSRHAIMTSYYLAQGLITWSILSYSNKP